MLDHVPDFHIFSIPLLEVEYKITTSNSHPLPLFARQLALLNPDADVIEQILISALGPWLPNSACSGSGNSCY